MYHCEIIYLDQDIQIMSFDKKCELYQDVFVVKSIKFAYF